MSPQVPKGPSIVQQELEWLDRLRAKLEPNIDCAVETLVKLSKGAAREQVREKAASKILSLYAQCSVDAAKLKLNERADEDEDDKDNVRVVVVAREDLGDVSQQLAANYQARRAAARDVS